MLARSFVASDRESSSGEDSGGEDEHINGEQDAMDGDGEQMTDDDCSNKNGHHDDGRTFVGKMTPEYFSAQCCKCRKCPSFM